jgi:glycosyltransferase involved in cell wall biosynthesis
MTQSRDNLSLYTEYSTPAELHQSVAVSVIIPTYMHAAFIRATLEGVLCQQTDFPFEVLVGEDCSPDDTLPVLRDLQALHPRILRILSFSINVGPHRNMEALISASRAMLIAHCDGDDQWTDPCKLAIQHRLFTENPRTKLIYHAAGTIDAKGLRQPYRIRRGLFSRVVTASEVILGDGGMIPTSSVMADKSVMTNEPAWQHEAPVGDYPLGIRAALEGEVIYVDRQMCDYRVSVPHSWTERHLPSFDIRLAYARCIDTMLTGVTASHPEYVMASRAVVSKYYSDVMVRYPAGESRARTIYEELCGRMHGHERLLAWLAVYHSIRLAWLKDLLRKTRTLSRLLAGHVTTRRIVLGPVVNKRQQP